MQIFAQEKRDGLEGKISSSNSIALVARIKPSDKKYVPDEKFIALAELNEQVDLFPIVDTLVSSGWNLNDDIFLPAELWKARATPVNKQINYMHDDGYIIGHITGQRFLTQDGKEITSEDELIDDVDIETSGVLYTCLRDTAKAEIVNKLIAEIPQGLWAVSMECLFNAFDYGMASVDGSIELISRTEATAWLTKHLRMYGGTGEFDGRKIGRVLRNFTFSGKGVVDQPANPRSRFKVSTLEGSINMDLQEEVTKLTTENASLKVQIEENKKVIASITALKDESVSAVQTAKADYEKLAEELKAIQEKFVQIEAAKKKAERKSKLSMCGLDETRQEEILTKFAEASDDIFEEMVKLASAGKPEKKKEMTKCEETESEDTKAEEVTQALEDSKVVDTTVSNTTTSDSEELKSVLAAFAKAAISNNKKGKK